MKHQFRVLLGVMLLAISLCVSAQDNNELIDIKEKVDRMPKISGFVQGMYQADFNEDFKLDDNTFSMRRVRMSIDGTLAKGLTYKIQGDFIRKPILVDAFVKYKVCDEFAIQAGQFKIPFSIESPINPLNLEIFDYGESIKNLVGYSDVCCVGSLGRDIGIMATGSLFPIELQNGQKFDLVDYSVGVFNGNGANEKDNNNRKDIVGRLDFHPWVKALTLSGSCYFGEYQSSDDYGVRNRWSTGVQYNDSKLVVRCEYLNGTTGHHTDKDKYHNGYYAVIGYNFTFGQEGKKQKLMPVFRYEHFTDEHYAHSAVLSGTTWYTAGIDYWPLKSVNCKLDYSLIMTGSDIDGHRVVGIVSYKF